MLDLLLLSPLREIADGELEAVAYLGSQDGEQKVPAQHGGDEPERAGRSAPCYLGVGAQARVGEKDGTEVVRRGSVDCKEERTRRDRATHRLRNRGQRVVKIATNTTLVLRAERTRRCVSLVIESSGRNKTHKR